MEKIITSLDKSFSRVRTGRASVSLLDGIKVDYYGAPTPIAQVATLSVPESRLIVIAPWDVIYNRFHRESNSKIGFRLNAF